tara:strand:- start:420 stop:680 length:261 start_codon:yes stop_codon:yes gene_type:complete
MNEKFLKNIVLNSLKDKDLTKSHTVKIKVPKKSLIKGMNAKEYADHMLWLSGFTGAKDVQSGIKRKVQRKTNKPVKSRKNNVQPKV